MGFIQLGTFTANFLAPTTLPTNFSAQVNFSANLTLPTNFHDKLSGAGDFHVNFFAPANFSAMLWLEKMINYNLMWKGKYIHTCEVIFVLF